MSELIHARLTAALESLHLNTAKANLMRHLRAAQERDLSTLAVLDALLTDELTARKERSIIVNTKLAHFPVMKTIDSFNFDAQPALDRRAINELQTLAFVERAEGIALLGPSGVGKTHLAIGLGMKALQAGVRVYFLSAQDLLDQIHAAQLDGIPGHKQRHLNNVAVLIIDEIGYVEFDKKTATWFFQLLCQRYERRSTIITSNQAFAEWGEIFGDTIIAGAMLDRYLHHCHVLNLKGESYRMRSRKRALAGGRAKASASLTSSSALSSPKTIRSGRVRWRSSTRTDGASPTTRIIGFSLRNECRAFAISAWRSMTKVLSGTISRANMFNSTALHQTVRREKTDEAWTYSRARAGSVDFSKLGIFYPIDTIVE